VTIDLLHANLAMLANQSAGWLASGESPGRLGNTHPSIEPFATYRAADGELMILAGNDGQFARLAAAIGLEPDERFVTNESRVRHRDEVRSAIEERLAARTRDEWRAALTAVGVPAGPVQTIGEAFSLADRLGLDTVAESDGVRTVAFPAQLSETPAVAARRPPELDEHGEEIRSFLRRD
jgi:formyl-CoA transferase